MIFVMLFFFILLWPLFALLLFRSMIFIAISRIKVEKKWDEKFYNSMEVFQDSDIEPSVVWSFLTDPEKIMHFNYKNRLKRIEFEQPLNLGSVIRIRAYNRYGFKGYISSFRPESKMTFEYHVWPHSTRYICEIEIIRLENKTRYVLRMKAKHLLVPLVIPLLGKICPRINEKVRNNLQEIISNVLYNCLVICEKFSEKDQRDLELKPHVELDAEALVRT